MNRLNSLKLNHIDFITFLRAAAAPFIALFLIKGWRLTGLLIVLGAALTDAMDGWLAKRSSKQTIFGKLIDPISDKILILTSLFAVYFSDGLIPEPIKFIFIISLIILTIRELWLTLLRISDYWLYYSDLTYYNNIEELPNCAIFNEIKKTLKSDKFGKTKMWLLTASVSLFILNMPGLGIFFLISGVISAYASWFKKTFKR